MNAGMLHVNYTPNISSKVSIYEEEYGPCNGKVWITYKAILRIRKAKKQKNKKGVIKSCLSDFHSSSSTFFQYFPCLYIKL